MPGETIESLIAENAELKATIVRWSAGRDAALAREAEQAAQAKKRAEMEDTIRSLRAELRECIQASSGRH